MQFSLTALSLTLASSVLALPAEQIFDKRGPLCGTNNFCVLADAQHVATSLIDMGDRQLDVGTSWTQLASYADCYVWAHTNSGTAKSSGYVIYLPRFNWMSLEESLYPFDLFQSQANDIE